MADQPVQHAFDDALTLTPLPDFRLRGRTTEPYANMVGPFGGITAATMLRAVELQDEKLGDPVSITVNYLAGVDPGEFDLAVRCVRTNRSTQHWFVEMTQGGDVVATATAVTALRRETWAHTEAAPPLAPPPSRLQPSERPPMSWPWQYEMRFVQGPFLGSGKPSNSSQSVVWVRDFPERSLDFASLTALCDSFYPRIYVRLGQPIPIGTVSMTIYFHATAEEVAQQGSDYLLGAARGSRYERGFFDQSAQLWGTGDKLLATSHQIVYYKG